MFISVLTILGPLVERLLPGRRVRCCGNRFGSRHDRCDFKLGESQRSFNFQPAPMQSFAFDGPGHQRSLASAR